MFNGFRKSRSNYRVRAVDPKDTPLMLQMLNRQPMPKDFKPFFIYVEPGKEK